MSSKISDPAADAEITLDVPDGPCGLCGGVLSWVEDWPTAGEHRWLCLRCASRPTPTLAEVYAGLTVEERQRLAAEANAGDDLARAIVNELGLDASPAALRMRR